MSQKELKKSDKKQKIICINHEFLINTEKPRKNLRKA